MHTAFGQQDAKGPEPPHSFLFPVPKFRSLLPFQGQAAGKPLGGDTVGHIFAPVPSTYSVQLSVFKKLVINI